MYSPCLLMPLGKIKNSRLQDLRSSPKEKPCNALVWLNPTPTHCGVELESKTQTLREEQPGQLQDAYLDGWQRAYCVNALMLLQSARETQDRLMSPIPGKKSNDKHIQVDYPWLEVTRWSIFSESGGPFQKITQEVTQTSLYPRERTLSYSREYVSLLHLGFHLVSRIFFSLPSLTSIAFNGKHLPSISIFFCFLLSLWVLWNCVIIYK